MDNYRTSQKGLPSASTSASPLVVDAFLLAFLETLVGLSSPELSLATKLLRRLPIVRKR